MRRALLQEMPEVVAHPFQLSPQLPIPNPFYNYALRAKELVPFAIVSLLVWKAVAKSIRF
jgi:hypothetical protein